MAQLQIGLGVSTSPGPGVDPVAEARLAEEVGFDYVSASDHLNGTMIIDRMGPVARLAARRILKELQQKWDDEHPGEGKKKK